LYNNNSDLCGGTVVIGTEFLFQLRIFFCAKYIYEVVYQPGRTHRLRQLLRQCGGGENYEQQEREDSCHVSVVTERNVVRKFIAIVLRDWKILSQLFTGHSYPVAYPVCELTFPEHDFHVLPDGVPEAGFHHQVNSGISQDGKLSVFDRQIKQYAVAARRFGDLQNIEYLLYALRKWLHGVVFQVVLNFSGRSFFGLQDGFPDPFLFFSGKKIPCHELKLYLGYLLSFRGRLKIAPLFEAIHTCKQLLREPSQVGVIPLYHVVKFHSFDRDPVLRAFKLTLKVKESLVCLEIGISFDSDQKPAKCR